MGENVTHGFGLWPLVLSLWSLVLGLGNLKTSDI